ncbi:virulence-associated E family protein, partial [Prevotella sp. P2-180]|uniref:virulence-associated E family protein n=1 Tax=Prevotella sp. P2-180 TaxID=2024224 RepID=UPI001C0EF1A7
MEKFSGTSEMTGNQMLVFEVEAYLEENFEFRRNVVSGKTEYRAINCDEWIILTEEALNSIVREAKKQGIGDDKSPRQDINEYVMSNAVKRYSPVCDFLETLPKWDGQNHIAGLFNRIPGMTTETMGWCAVWFRSMVAHWLQMDSQHGNETVPVLIGRQGCGKSTFALRLLPESL